MQEENSKIPFSIRLKEDGSYAFAEAKLTNNGGGGNSEEIG